MIENEQGARKIGDLMIEFGRRLDASVALVRDRGTPGEFQAYRRSVGKVTADLRLEIMDPLYAEHPSLKPAGPK